MLGGGAKKRYCLENRFGKRRHAAAADLHEIGAVVGAFQSIGGRVSFGPVQTRGEGETHHERGTSRGADGETGIEFIEVLMLGGLIIDGVGGALGAGAVIRSRH